MGEVLYIAKQWADAFDYPLDDIYELAKVAQLLAIEEDEEMSENIFSFPSCYRYTTRCLSSVALMIYQ
jgi:hypothetical protein